MIIVHGYNIDLMQAFSLVEKWKLNKEDLAQELIVNLRCDYKLTSSGFEIRRRTTEKVNHDSRQLDVYDVSTHTLVLENDILHVLDMRFISMIIGIQFFKNNKDKYLNLDKKELTANEKFQKLRYYRKNKKDITKAKGYTAIPGTTRFKVQLRLDGKVNTLGRFDSEEEARACFVEAANNYNAELEADLDYYDIKY